LTKATSSIVEWLVVAAVVLAIVFAPAPVASVVSFSAAIVLVWAWSREASVDPARAVPRRDVEAGPQRAGDTEAATRARSTSDTL
jgi:hypothetical protein